MFRRKTVEALLRHHERREQALLGIVRDQNDRIMMLAGKQYAPSPLDLAIPDAPEPEFEDVSYADVDQLPDTLDQFFV